MDFRIPSAARPDIVAIESLSRPTPRPVRVSFDQVLAAGVSGVVRGAELVANHLPGAPVAVAAVRGTSGGGTSVTALNLTAEGPGATVSQGLSATTPALLNAALGGSSSGTTTGGVATADASGGLDASLSQSAQLSLYYLQVQQQVDAQNRSFTALSNVLKTEHDSAKAAIQNIHA
jgi:hypothetical protein